MSEARLLACHEIRPYLAPFTDGELDELSSAAVAAHMARCEACAEVVARARRLDRALAVLPATRPSGEVFARIQAAVQAATDGERAGRETITGGSRQREALRDSVTAHTGGALTATATHDRARRMLVGPVAALAALLLITVSVLAIHRAALPGMSPAAGVTPLPATGASALAQTSAAVATLSRQRTFGFVPVLPTYLPPGSRLLRTSAAAAGAAAGTGYLDVTWTMPGAVSAVHLREAPAGDGWPQYTPAPGANVVLSWQVGADPWRPLIFKGDASRLAVGEQRTDVTIALDALAARPGTSADDIAATLRLISLSMDAPFAPTVIVPLNAAGLVTHFQARATAASSTSPWTEDGYLDAASGTTSQRLDVTVTAANGRYRDIETGGRVLRLDLDAHTYAYPQTAAGLVGAVVSDPALTQLFYGANTLAAVGSLWNMGRTTYGGVAAYEYVLVSAPQPTHVYVNARSEQVIAVVVDSTAAEHPGGSAAPWPLLGTAGCPAFTLLEYEAPNRVPAGTFDEAVPAGFRPGKQALSVSC